MMRIGVILFLITLIITTISHIALTKASLPGVQKKEYEPEVFGNIWSKRLEIYSGDGKEYTYVFVLVSVPENIDNIELYKEFDDETQQRISSNKDYSFKKLDRDNDEKVDYVSWIIPELGSEKFSIQGKYIEITETLTTSTSSTKTTVQTTTLTTINSLISNIVTSNINTYRGYTDNNFDLLSSWYPENGNPVGLEYNSTSKVYHLWNERDDYYINATSGVQITNHYENYWTHNTFCVWIYTGTQWVRRCSDTFNLGCPVCGWTESTDNQTHAELNRTIYYEEGVYKAYFKVSYYLYTDASKINISLGVRNAGQNISDSYIGWIVSDIKIDGDQEDDWVMGYDLDLTSHAYNLSEDLEMSFDEYDMTRYYRLYENTSDVDVEIWWDDYGWKKNDTDWNQNNMSFDLVLNHSMFPSQYNTPVILMIRVGRLNKTWEATTNFWWYDATYRKCGANLCGVYDGSDSTCPGFSSYCSATQKCTGVSTCTKNGAASCGAGYCDVCGECSGSSDTCNIADCGPHGSCVGGNVCTGQAKGAENCVATIADGLGTCYCDDMCTNYPPSICDGGICTPPKPGWSNSAVNDTEIFADDAVNHTIVISQSPEGYIFSWNGTNDCSGTWENSSYITTSPTSAWNVSTPTSNCEGKIIGWKYYANNTGGWNVSDEQTYSVSAYGWLNATLLTPTPDQQTSWDQYTLYNINATVECKEGECGTVSGSTIYNKSSINPDTPINTTVGGNPFYLIGSGGGENWWDANWNYRRTLTSNNSEQSESLNNFTVMVKLNSSNFVYNNAKNDGTDLRFIDADNTTELNYHLEIWNTSGNSFAWVKIPTIDGSSESDYIWMYYGYDSATNAQNVEDTYDDNYIAVWHLNESTGNHKDATRNNYDAFSNFVTQQGQNIGKIDGADEFEKTSSNQIVINGLLGQQSTITIEAWAKGTSSSLSQELVSLGDAVLIRAVNDGSGTDIYGIYHYGSGAYNSLQGAGEALTDSEWHYVMYVLNPSGNNQKLYKDGRQLNSDTKSDSVSYSGLGSNTVIGNHGNGGSWYFDGVIDEVRISNTTRSADWMNASYLTTDDRFITYGDEEDSTALNTISCGSMSDGDSCQLNWTVNVTGTQGTEWEVGGNFSSSYSSVNENTTNNATILITANLPPQWKSNYTSVASGTAYSPSANFGFEINWTDPKNGMRDVSQAVFQFDGTNYTKNDSPGVQNNTEGIYWINLTDLAAGNYNFKWFANDTDGKENTTDQWTYVISKASAPIVNLYLNDTLNSNKDYTTDEVANITIEAVSRSGDTIYIYTNYSDGSWKEWDSGTSPHINLTQLSVEGIWNFTANYTNQNYTSNYSSYIVNVTTKKYLVVNLTNPDPGVYTISNHKDQDQNTTFVVNATIECQTTPSGKDCGTVSGSIRYNDTATTMALINETEGGTPFYISGGGSWWDSDWSYRKQLNITNNNETETLEDDYVVNYNLNHSGLVSESKSVTNGSDIRIVWYNTTDASWNEIDRHNQTSFNSEDTELWFKVQKNITASSYDNNYYIYYNNPSADAPSENLDNIYGIDRMMIFHFSDNYLGVDGEVLTEDGGTNPDFDPGRMGKGITINESDRIRIDCSGNFNEDQGTIELWFNPGWSDSESQENNFWDARQHPNGVFGQYKTSYDTFKLFYYNGSENSLTSGSMSWSAGEWKHIAFVWNESGREIFVNGVSFASDSVNATGYNCSTGNNAFHIGSIYLENENKANGTIDEFKVWSVRKSADELSYINPEPSISTGEETSTQANTISCGSMSDGDSCQLNWTVNATGVNGSYLIDANFTSSYGNSNVPDNNTNNAYICIGGDCVAAGGDSTYPQWSSNTTSPSSPVTYSEGASYQFNVTWTEDNKDTIQIEHNLTGSTTPHNDSFTGNNSNEYYFNTQDLASGTYVWRSFANDSTGNSNVTNDGYWTYTVSKATPILTLNNNTASVNTSGLVGYWRLESFNSTNGTEDYSGYGSDGVGYNFNTDPASTVTGMIGEGSNFTGDNDYILVNHASNLDVTTEFTISAWIKTGSKNDGMIFSKGDFSMFGTTSKIALGVINGKVSTLYKNTLTNDAGNTYVNDSQWHFVAWVYSSTNNIWKIYVDGSEDKSREPADATSADTSDAIIGVYKSYSSLNTYFNGTIDEVKVWNRPLTIDELKILYKSEVIYGTETTFNGICPPEITCNFYRNTTDRKTDENGTAVTLGAGYHYYLFNTSGNANYTRSAILLPLNISKGTSNISLFINNTEGNTNIQNNTAVNITTVSNCSGSVVSMTTNRTGWSSSSSTTPYENITEVMYGPEVDGKINVTGWWDGNENYTGDSQSYYVNITEPSACSVALAVSDVLSDGIAFGNIGQGTINDAAGNNENSDTDYYVSVQISGCTPSTMNVSIRANDDLKNGASVITLSNEKFRNSTSDNTVDSNLQNISLTTNFVDNQIGSVLNNNDKIYLKYDLTAPSPQKAGLYNNTIQIWGGRSDLSPP